MPQKNAAHPQKNSHTNKEIQEAITLKSQVSKGTLPRIHCISLGPPPPAPPPIGKPQVNTPDLYNILDMWGGGGVLQVLQLKGAHDKINRNDGTFYKIYTFISKVC